MIRASVGAGRVHAGEGDVFYGTARSFVGTEPAGVIFCHGAGDLILQPMRDQLALFEGLGRHATVVAADLGGDTWANDTGIARVGEAVTQLRAAWGQSGPVALVAMSMGAAVALAYALAHPENVACVAGVIPLTDLANAQITLGPTGIDAAYPPAYNDGTNGPTHSPIRFAADLDPDLPIHLWSASNDIYTPHAVTEAFVAARPQTGLTNLGALGHTDAAVTAATPAIVAFVREHMEAS